MSNRQHRTSKSVEVSWRCLGKSCGASIKTDKHITRVTVCNSKHSSEHCYDALSLGPNAPKSGSPTVSASTSVPDIPPALDTPCTPCKGPAFSTPGQVSVLTFTPSGGGLPSGALARMIVRVASERPLKTSVDMAIPTVTSSPTINQEPAAVTPQNQYSGRLQHVSYAEAVRNYPVLDSGVKSGSPAAVPQGVNVGQAASVPHGVESLRESRKEASEHTLPTIRQTDSQSTFLMNPLFGKANSNR
ncbi:hypothetical protein J6590_086567, partial [Homalodisca vitripennis]